ncbi:hypothetical protein ACSDR0_00835 [Streptosporangium sp. G11]
MLYDVDGASVADSRILFETGPSPRYRLSKTGIRLDPLTATGTHCP